MSVGKKKIWLTDNIYAVLTVKLEIPKEQEAVADANGVGKEERANLVEQTLSAFLYLIGNSDDA